MFLLPITAQAYEVKNDPSIYVAKDQVVEGNFYAVGQTITVDGKVNGDLICAGQTIDISGEVVGDVICAGQVVTISGKVGGSVRAAGNAVAIKGEVARNVMAFGATVSLSNSASVGWDMMVGAGALDERGKIGGTLHGGAGTAVIAGEIGKGVKISLGGNENSKNGLTIEPTAKIDGNLTYTDKFDAEIKNGASIKGETKRNEPKIRESKKEVDKKWMAVGLGVGWVYSLLVGLLIGFVLIALWKKQIIELTDKMFKETKASIAWGFAIMFLTPIAIIIVMMTIIGIPLALLVLGMWVAILFLSKIIVGIMVGRKLLERFWHKKKDSLALAVLFGMLTVSIIFSVPFLGWIIALVGAWWGIGGIWVYYRKS